MIKLHLKPELEAGLMAQARAVGTTPEVHVQHLVEKDLSSGPTEVIPSDASGMVCDNGLLVYGAGTALPAGFLDHALRQNRDERGWNLLDGQD